MFDKILIVSTEGLVHHERSIELELAKHDGYRIVTTSTIVLLAPIASNEGLTPVYTTTVVIAKT